VYQSKLSLINGNSAGIHTEPIDGKAVVIKGGTYIYNGNLYLAGDIHKGTFNDDGGIWSNDEKLNDYFVMKGVKANSCININSSIKILGLDYDVDDFELGVAPNNALNLKYKIHGVNAPITNTSGSLGLAINNPLIVTA
jgi:hypothetical protein